MFKAFRDNFAQEDGASQYQSTIERAERASKYVFGFQPHIIHGLLQTPDYARQLLSLPGGPVDHGATDDDVARLISVRMRRQELLHEPGRQVTIVVGEAALRNRVASPGIMAEQLRHIAKLATAVQATIGVLPFSAPAAYLHGWEIRDDAVTVETETGDLELADPEQVTQYRRLSDLILGAACTREDAAAFCIELATESYGRR